MSKRSCCCAIFKRAVSSAHEGARAVFWPHAAAVCLGSMAKMADELDRVRISAAELRATVTSLTNNGQNHGAGESTGEELLPGPLE